MRYYRVKPEYDQKQRIKNHKYSVKRKPDGIYVANELYTAGELEKFYLTWEQERKGFEIVEIPKNKVYWFFGCRFAMEGAEKYKEANEVMNHYDEGCKKWSNILMNAK